MVVNLNKWLPLLFGSLIYLFFRQDAYIIIFEQHFPLFAKIRDAVFISYYPESVIGKFFLYHLTDFLWAYALAWAMLVAAKRKKRALALCSMYCTFTEVLQLWPWLRATFDFMDILCQLAGILLAYIGYIKIINE